jgi:pyruvate/2-oxoglutarate dehydrogenase complex dihydrolipoamide dehydrogenase (E3) component
MPSKTLLRPGQVLAAARRVPGAAPAAGGGLDAGQALARRDWMTACWDDAGQARWLEGAGATLLRGRGRLAGERAVEVESTSGFRRRLAARRAVILATGSTPVLPPIEGLRDIRTWDSRDATSAKQVPGRLLVLGGGAVGAEMAQAWRRLGSREVIVVEASGRLLPGEEPFAGDQVGAAFAAEGIAIIAGTRMTAAHRAAGDGPVTATLAGGQTMTADEILVATGRRPGTDGLGLETVGLEPGRPVSVDDAMRAAGVRGGWLYAVGDVNGRSPVSWSWPRPTARKPWTWRCCALAGSTGTWRSRCRTHQERAAILAVHARGKHLAADADLAVTARGTPGFLAPTWRTLSARRRSLLAGTAVRS